MDLEFEKEIGHGAFGRVWLAADMYLPRKYAVKFFDRKPETAQYDALMHARSLARVEHPAVVRLYSFEDQTHPETKVSAPALIMEYIEGGTLEDVRTTLAGQHADKVVIDMIAGVEAIHAAGIIHGDLYDKNVLITRSGAKIIDILCRLSPEDFGTRTARMNIRDDLRALANLVRQVLERREKVDVRALGDAYYQAFTHAASTNEIRAAYTAVCPGLAGAPGSAGAVSSASDAVLRDAVDRTRGIRISTEPTPTVSNAAAQPSAASTNVPPVPSKDHVGASGDTAAPKPGAQNPGKITAVAVQAYRPAESTAFFHDRMCDAFPGVVDTCLVTSPGEIITRLKHLLKNPLEIERNQPIWEVGRGTMGVPSFKVLNKTIVLVGHERYRVSKLLGYRSRAYWRDFVLLYWDADEPTGLYPVRTAEELGNRVNRYGYCTEEYGVYGKKLVTRQEYDDGTVFVNGKPKQISARLEVRHLTPGAAFLVAQRSPLNDVRFDIERERLLSGLVQGSVAHEQLVAWVEKLPRHRRDEE
ncbi:protein kinase domain-containing protein [Sorangium sp. So ce426]|uniref:protein kinase family protein n=1 Tax=Sorangium sp. So ce426 TaxID=3133312 RepID=UPI003F5CA76F